MRMRAVAVGFAFGSIVAACSAPPPTPPTFVGTVHGETFAPAEAVSGEAFIGPSNDILTFLSTTGIVVLRNTPGICEDFDARVDRRDAQYFTIALYAVDPYGTPGPATAPGTFAVGPTTASQYADASFWSEDSDCNIVLTAKGIRGTVTLTSVGDHFSYAGTFDVILDSGDEVSGSFDASACSSLHAALGPTCS